MAPVLFFKAHFLVFDKLDYDFIQYEMIITNLAAIVCAKSSFFFLFSFSIIFLLSLINSNRVAESSSGTVVAAAVVVVVEIDSAGVSPPDQMYVNVKQWFSTMMSRHICVSRVPLSVSPNYFDRKL
jgi:hypothetical protein